MICGLFYKISNPAVAFIIFQPLLSILVSTINFQFKNHSSHVKDCSVCLAVRLNHKMELLLSEHAGE